MSNLTNKQLEHFKKLLLNMKETATRDVSNFSNLDQNDDLEQLSPHTNHPADAATSQYENEFNQGLEQFSEEQLQNIDDALAKIENGTYGKSEKSGKSIPIERLEALPTARNLVEEEE